VHPIPLITFQKRTNESEVYHPATAEFSTSYFNNPVSRYKTVVFTGLQRAGSNIFQTGLQVSCFITTTSKRTSTLL